jgi:hypothetical protein
VRRTLAALAGGSARRGFVDLPSEEEVGQVQHRFLAWLREWVHKRRVTLGPLQGEFWIEAVPGPSGEDEAVIRFDLPLPSPDTHARIAFQLALLLGGVGQLVKECPAPKAWGKGELCGRLFLASRPNQVYCSSQCQNRMGTQLVRKRRQED